MAFLAMAAFVAVHLAATVSYKAVARDDAQHVAVVLLQVRTRISSASSALQDCAPGDDWMNQKSLLQKFDNRTIRTLIDNGLIESRTNPDFSDSMQYRYLEEGDEGWITEEALHRIYDKFAIQHLFSDGRLSLKVNPDCPHQKQYFLSKLPNVRPPERSEARNSTLPLRLIARRPRSSRRAARRKRKVRHSQVEVLKEKEHEEGEATSASDIVKNKVKSFAKKFGQRRSRKHVKASKATAKASAKAAKKAKMTGDKASKHFKRVNDHQPKAEKPYKSGVVRKIVQASKKAVQDAVQKAKHGGSSN